MPSEISVARMSGAVAKLSVAKERVSSVSKEKLRRYLNQIGLVLFQHFISRNRRPPTLVRFLWTQPGLETALSLVHCYVCSELTISLGLYIDNVYI